MRRALPVLALLALSACAQTQQQVRQTAVEITAATLDGAGITFEGVAAGMRLASDAHELSVAQVEAWNDFLARWKAAYPNACAIWRAAKSTGDDVLAARAASILATMLGQLDSWIAISKGSQS